MKTLTITIIYTHSDPITRDLLRSETEELCETFGADISIDEEY